MASNLNLTRLSDLDNQLESYKGDRDACKADGKNRYKVFLGILHSICDVVRKADGSPNFQDVVIQADQLLNDAVRYAYKKEFFEVVPSFAHSDANPSILSKNADEVFTLCIPFINMMLGKDPTEPTGRIPLMPESWPQTKKPHPLTTRLSRFRGNVAVSVTSDTPIANVIYEARCEITDDLIVTPINLTLSTDGACMVLLGAGGYKERSPVLNYYFPTDGGNSLSGYVPETGLSSIAYYSTTDAQRKLIFIADNKRIKSFTWGSASGETYEEWKPTHTMNSGCWNGPIAILGDNRIIRAGPSSVGVWDLDSLETHVQGKKGRRRIGGVFNIEDSWRDDPEEIERSVGSAASNTIKINENEAPKIARWHPHPTTPGVMLCRSNASGAQDYSCFALDLEHGGNVTSRYLGHGGRVQQFSTSPGDLNTFATACADGYTRLYDVRHPLPVLTLGLGHRTASCTSVVLVHPDGIPTVFTGGDHTEQIEMWDIRARSVVYELSTGNNAVASMVWDSNHNALYAATTCQYIDRIGYNHGYRRAVIPKDQKPEKNERAEERHDDEDDDSEYDEDEDSDDDDERCWPEQAYHNENYFGYLFDSGEHRIFRYAFKESPDTSILPSYGQATLESDSYW